MENVHKNIEESKEGEQRDHQKTFDSQSNPESIIESLTLVLNNLFEPNNLSNNHYLVQRSNGVSFQIPVKFIYDENSIRSLTYDHFLIDQAIERAENVVAIKRDEHIEFVKPKTDQLRKTIIVKGITKDDENELKKIIDQFDSTQEGIVNWNFNQQLNVVNIICKDEKFASELYNHLIHTTFKDSPLDCSLNFENLYIAALENMKKRPKRTFDHPKNRPFMMPQYTMPFMYNPMNNGGFMKNYFPPNNFFMQQRPYNVPQNQNINGPVNRPQQNYYHKNNGGGGGRRGGFNKRLPGKRGGRYHKNGGGRPSQPSNVEVNDSDFPPLSNENQKQDSPQ